MKNFLRLSSILAKTNLKVKYGKISLGILWYLLEPLLTFILLSFIFSTTFGKTIENYNLYLFIGIIMMHFFQQATIESSKMIVINKSLIKSSYFKREALIGSTIAKTSFLHLFEIIILFIFLSIVNIPKINIIFYIPALILLAIFSYGVGLALSSLTVYFRNIENVWIFVARLLWFVTPIFYVLEDQLILLNFNLFNPLFYLLSLARDMIINTNFLNASLLVPSLLFSLFYLVIGITIFKILEKKFAEKL